MQNTERKNLEKEAAANKQKIEYARALWAKGQPLQGTIAERYLKEHRKITGSKEWPEDFRYLPNVKLTGEQNAQKTYPCLMVAARSNEGDITAVQLTFLDPTTANKAHVPVQKRSFGLLKGSSVMIQACPLERVEPEKNSNLLFIAEGVETALSLREAVIEGTIKASLGLANVRRLEPQNPKTHIVICGDHDAPDSPALKNLEKSVITLQERGFKITVLKPEQVGEDFNDVLKAKGPEGIREILKQAVPHALKQPVIIKDTSPAPRRTSAQEVLNQITKNCEWLLSAHIAEKNIFLTPELKERIPLQAERAANFIFYAHTLNGTSPTEKETKRFLERAKYELDRVPQIKEKLRDEWCKKGKFNETSSPLMIHMIAERQASIEGRLFLEAREAGQKPSPNIPQLAEAEFNSNKARTKAFAQQFAIKYSLSNEAGKECSRNILRYQETHGTKPTNTQRAAMAEIARQLGNKFINSSEKDSHNLTYLRRMNGDAMLQERCYEAKASIAQEQNIIKIQEKALLEAQKQRIVQEVLRQKERDFSMSM